MDRKVVRYIWGVAGLAVPVAASVVVFWPPSARVAPEFLWALVAVTLLTVSEIPFAHIHYRPHGESFTFEEGILFVLFGLFSPGVVVLMGVAAMVVSQVAWRTVFIKRVFNSGQYTISVAAGGVAAWTIGASAAVGSARHLAGCLVGVVVYEAVNRTLVMKAVSLANKTRWLKGIADGFPVVGLSIAALAPVGALALVLIRYRPIFLLLLTAPAIAFFVASRRALEGNRRAETTNQILALGDDLNASLELEARVLVLADGIRSMLRSAAAEVILLDPAGGATRTRTSVDASPEILATIVLGIDTGPNPYSHVIATGESQLYLTGRGDGPIVSGLARQGIKDLAAAPMAVDGEITGILLAVNRMGPETFSAEDLRVLAGVAQLASGALVSAQAYATEKASAERLRELDRMKSDFIASVSHELRTPLTLIHGFAMTLDQHGDRVTAEVRSEFVAKIVRHSHRLTRLIEGVLAATRWDQRKIEDETTISLTGVVREVLDQLAELAGDRQIVVELPHDLPRIRAAAERVEHVLANLVENALKYSHAPAPVAIRARRVDGGVALEVVDRGPGIPADLQDKVFDRFYQVDQTSTRRVGGTGLGLYLVKNLVEAVGGRAELDSVPGQGSTFRVVLPTEGEVVPFPRRMGRVL